VLETQGGDGLLQHRFVRIDVGVEVEHGPMPSRAKALQSPRPSFSNTATRSSLMPPSGAQEMCSVVIHMVPVAG
jgi:hypothetical protein